MEPETASMLTYAKSLVLKFIGENMGNNPNGFKQCIRVGQQFPCALALNDAQGETFLSGGTQ